MLPCVWRCMNQRMDSSLQFNDGIVLRHFHLWHEGAENLLPTAYLYTPACYWAQRTNCCLLAILPSADADELGNRFLGSSPMQMDWFSSAKPAHSLEPGVADLTRQSSREHRSILSFWAALSKKVLLQSMTNFDCAVQNMTEQRKQRFSYTFSPHIVQVYYCSFF